MEPHDPLPFSQYVAIGTHLVSVWSILVLQSRHRSVSQKLFPLLFPTKTVRSPNNYCVWIPPQYPVLQQRMVIHISSSSFSQTYRILLLYDEWRFSLPAASPLRVRMVGWVGNIYTINELTGNGYRQSSDKLMNLHAVSAYCSQMP